MAKHTCETCGQEAERLFQSYASGKWECADDALNDPGMSPEQEARIRRYAKRQEQARRNFGKVVREPAEHVAAEEGRLFL
ncbi:MAG: hypothetical protein M3416_01410 [Acidobacteriota bacterium]|nr:hypothetical protein [Acidobacteriota bacterium]